MKKVATKIATLQRKVASEVAAPGRMVAASKMRRLNYKKLRTVNLLTCVFIFQGHLVRLAYNDLNTQVILYAFLSDRIGDSLHKVSPFEMAKPLGSKMSPVNKKPSTDDWLAAEG
jgi:hypothetical protein